MYMYIYVCACVCIYIKQLKTPDMFTGIVIHYIFKEGKTFLFNDGHILFMVIWHQT